MEYTCGLSVELYTLDHYTTHNIDFSSSGWEELNNLLTGELECKRTAGIGSNEIEISTAIASKSLEADTEKAAKNRVEKQLQNFYYCCGSYNYS
ncbi:hypothetical protein [Domibacillus robiginosus]|uniref:hypothetical protein n=1 Tax=Domibacillus robiginosus TaxID=1071054 RepID=UPI00067D087A|nr:hypothetical protein [Domibacillus robiginosus]